MKYILAIYVGLMSPAECASLTHSQLIDELATGKEVVLIRCVPQPFQSPLPIRKPVR